MWFPGTLPEGEARPFLTDIFSRFTSADVGGGAIGGSPVVGRTTRPLLRLPRAAVGFALLLSRQATSPAEVEQFLADNRRLHDDLVARGGKRYPCDAIPDMTRQDWREHYDNAWASW